MVLPDIGRPSRFLLRFIHAILSYDKMAYLHIDLVVARRYGRMAF